MSKRQLLFPKMEAAAAQGGFACPRGFLGAAIGYLMAWTHGWRNIWVLSLLDAKPDDRVLEIGFGPGTEIGLVARLAKRGLVAGIDPSEVMLRQASRRNRAYIREGQVELRLASMSAILIQIAALTRRSALIAFSSPPICYTIWLRSAAY